MTTATSPVQAARYSGDISAQQAIEADEELKKVLDNARSNYSAHAVRQQLLSEAVRINPRLLPGLAQTFQEVAARARIEDQLELYVYASSEINACIIPAYSRKLVMLSSGAIEGLTAEELTCVIGHELGHTLYGHLEMPVRWVLEHSSEIAARQAKQLLAWNRKAEISADRAGLVCCGSIEIAASAMFKTMSGLSIEGLSIAPQEFAAQWDELASEIRRDAAGDYWRAAHPFPPLRMKALLLFYNSDLAAQLVPGAAGAAGRTGTSLSEADEAIERCLAVMDPLARGTADAERGADPLLADFLLWGGLYVATAESPLQSAERESLCSLVGRERVDRALAEGELGARELRERFLAAKQNRRARLKGLELHRIFSGLSGVAKALGPVGSPARSALHDLAEICGVNASFVDSLL